MLKTGLTLKIDEISIESKSITPISKASTVRTPNSVRSRFTAEEV